MCSLHEDWGINCCEFHVAGLTSCTTMPLQLPDLFLNTLNLKAWESVEWCTVIIVDQWWSCMNEAWNQRQSETSPPVGVSGGPFGIEPQKLQKTSLANFRHAKNSPWWSTNSMFVTEKEITWNHLSHPKLSRYPYMKTKNPMGASQWNCAGHSRCLWHRPTLRQVAILSGKAVVWWIAWEHRHSTSRE